MFGLRRFKWLSWPSLQGPYEVFVMHVYLTFERILVGGAEPNAANQQGRSGNLSKEIWSHTKRSFCVGDSSKSPSGVSACHTTEAPACQCRSPKGETDRQTDRQTHRQTNRQTNNQSGSLYS